MRAAPRRPPLLRSRAATPRALGRADGGASAVRQRTARIEYVGKSQSCMVVAGGAGAVRQRARADHPRDGLEGPGG